jgi:hypothetical protein
MKSTWIGIPVRKMWYTNRVTVQRRGPCLKLPRVQKWYEPTEKSAGTYVRIYNFCFTRDGTSTYAESIYPGTFIFSHFNSITCTSMYCTYCMYCIYLHVTVCVHGVAMGGATLTIVQYMWTIFYVLSHHHAILCVCKYCTRTAAT